MEKTEQSKPDRKRRFWKWVVIGCVTGLALLLVAFVSLWVAMGQMPRYGGKPAEEWLADVSTTNRAEALKAFHEMGPKSLPYLVKALGRRESLGRTVYKRVHRVTPAFIQKHLPPPAAPIPLDQIWNSASAALINDPQARTALPELSQMLNDKEVLSHDKIAGVIALLAGPGDEACVSNLVVSLNDPNPGIRQTVATALAKFGPGAKLAIPELTARLNDPSADARVQIAWALWKIDRQTNACRESMKSVFADKPSQGMAELAMDHLMEIDPQDGMAVSYWIRVLEGKDDYPRMRACVMLAKSGSAAKEAVPLLIKCVETGGPDLRRAALGALKGIDAEVAARYEGK